MNRDNEDLKQFGMKPVAGNDLVAEVDERTMAIIDRAGEAGHLAIIESMHDDGLDKSMIQLHYPAVVFGLYNCMSQWEGGDTLQSMFLNMIKFDAQGKN